VNSEPIYQIIEKLEAHEREHGSCERRARMRERLLALAEKFAMQSKPDENQYDSKKGEFTQPLAVPPDVAEILDPQALSLDEIADIARILLPTVYHASYGKMRCALPGGTSLRILNRDDVDEIDFRVRVLPTLCSITVPFKSVAEAISAGCSIPNFMRRHGALALNQEAADKSVTLFFDDEYKATEARIRI
jgi:hypothetical protein